MDRTVSATSFSPLNTLIQVSKDTLAEALSSDATLAGFFNAFLQLPVFPRPMAYVAKHRVVEEEAAGQTDVCKSPRTCSNVMKWVRDCRAELFLRSSLFSEYKLCILLTRSGTDHHWGSLDCCSEGSSTCNIKALRDMQTALRTPEIRHDMQNVDAINLDVARNSTITIEQRAKSEDLRNRTNREMSLAKASSSLKSTSRISLRQIEVLSASSKRSSESYREAQKSVRISTCDEKVEFKDTKTAHSSSSRDALHSRVVSAKTEKDGEYIYGERLTFHECDLGEFDYDTESDDGDTDSEGDGDCGDGNDDDEEDEDEDNPDKQTEADLIDLESRTGKNFSQMMTDTLSSVAGMTSFKAFLLGKVGYNMLNAWLDIDKVTGSNVVTLTNKQLRRSLRQLAEKYSGTVVGSRAVSWLRKYHRRRSEINPLIQIQISILRRLNNYWCPRFIVHSNRSQDTVSSGCNMMLTVKPSPSYCRSLSLSLEKTGHLIVTVSEKCDLLPLRERIQSARVMAGPHRPYSQLVTAIQCDIDAGGPFAAFLRRSHDDLLSNTLLFLQSLWQLVSCLTLWRGTPSIRLSSAWNLWNTYLKDDCIHPIAVERTIKESLSHIFSSCEGYVSVDHFQDVECQAVDALQPVWVEYLQHDDNLYISQCYPKQEPDISTSSHTSPQPLSVDTRPKDSLKTPRLQKRKKTRRSKWNSSQQNVALSESKTGDVSSGDGLDRVTDNKGEEVAQPEHKPLSFANLTRNDMVINAFKDFLLHGGDNVALNRVLLWLDIQEILLVHKTSSSRTSLSIQAHKNYFHEKSKRSVDLPDTFKEDLNVKSTSHRPSTGMLSAVQAHFVPIIQSKFEEFLQTLILPHTDQTIESLSALQILLQKRRKNKKGTGRGTATPELQAELSTILVNTEGPWPHKLNSFRSYLKCFGAADGYPLSENNLSFWIEVQKLKDMLQGSADKVFVKRKANVVADCYLDCSNPPWLQVDLPAEFAHRLLNNMRGSQPHHTKTMPRLLNVQLLNEAQAQVLKELVPFWAGFVKRYKPPSDGDEAEQNFNAKKGKQQKGIGRKNSVVKRRTKTESNAETGVVPSIVYCSLPPLPTTGSHAVCRHLTFSLATGAHWRASQDAVCEASSNCNR